MVKQQWEEEAVERFLHFLQETLGEAWNVLDRDVVVDPSTNRNFDYRLAFHERRMALELFRLVDDEEELAQSRVWSEIVNALERELARRCAKGYLLTTPSYFMVPKVKRSAFVRNLADKIEELIAAEPVSDEIKFEEFSLKRIEGLNTIACSAFGRGGAVNPPGIALAALHQMLPKKNDQLAIDEHERVLLVVNWAHLVDNNDALDAVSAIDFRRFLNVDKIFFEVTRGGCKQIFDRRIFDDFERGSAVTTGYLEPLFVQWLEQRLARKARDAFDITKKMIIERGGVLWLPSHRRIDMVRYGMDFVERGDWDNVKWIFETFKRDPDPSIENEEHDPRGQFNLHTITKNGESVRFIQTVRGYLSWLLLAIVKAHRTELFEEVFSTVEQYALGDHLYVRRQVMVPLSELTKHRRSNDAMMTQSLKDRIRALALRVVKDNANYPAVLEGVANVLASLHDLNPLEAEEALNILIERPTNESVGLLSHMLIYYAEYRKREEANLGPFDSTRLAQLLKRQLLGGLATLRSSILWQIAGILKNKSDEAGVLLPYLAIFGLGAYDRNGYFHFFAIAAEYAKSYPDLLGPALRNGFNCECAYLRSHEGLMIWDFDRQRLTTLIHLAEAGRTDDFLDCLERVMRYRERIQNFPAELIIELLIPISSKRATTILNSLQN